MSTVTVAAQLRYAAFDLDGTLLDENGSVRAGIVDGLARLRDRGVVPLVATGRTATSYRLLRLDDQLAGLLDDDVLVADGNAVVCGERVHLTRPLPHAATDRARSCGLPNVVDTGDKLVASDRGAALSYAMAYQLPRSAVEVGPADRTALSVTVFAPAARVRAALAANDCEVDSIRPFGASVVRPEGTSKATALLAHLRARFSATGLDQVVAFGDGRNDSAMLARCGVGVAVKGGHPEAAAAAGVRLDIELGEYLARFEPAPARPGKEPR